MSVTSKLGALLASILLTYSLAPIAPAVADNHMCKPSGEEGAMALPDRLVHASPPLEPDYTTPDVVPLTRSTSARWGLARRGS